MKKSEAQGGAKGRGSEDQIKDQRMCEWETNSVKLQGAKIRDILNILGQCIDSYSQKGFIEHPCRALTQEEVAAALLGPESAGKMPKSHTLGVRSHQPPHLGAPEPEPIV